MKRRYKVYLRINLVSVAFIVVSCISATLAWFAYSGLADVQTDVDVRSWYVELKKDNEVITNDIVINLDEIYPGMATKTENISIENLGDADANVSYEIVSARILGDAVDYYEVSNDLSTADIEAELLRNYPFKIDLNLTRDYASSDGLSSEFSISIAWPLDSGDDSLDSLWGNKAYQFQKNERELYENDNTYQIRPSIQLIISVKAEQFTLEECRRIDYIETDGSQYIDTLFKPNQDTKVEIKIGIDETIVGTSALMGARTSTSSNVYAIFASTNAVGHTSQTRNDYFGSRISQIYNGILPIGQSIIIKDKGQNYINGIVQTGNIGGITFNCEYNLYIGTINTSNTPHPEGFIGRIYYVKIWDDGVLIRNLIPVQIKENDVIAMYDLVNNQYYQNIGDGEFITNNQN